MLNRRGVLVGAAAAVVALALLKRRRRRDEKKPPVSDTTGGIIDLFRAVRAGSFAAFLAQRRRVLGDCFILGFPFRTVAVLNSDDVIAVSAQANRLHMSVKMPPGYEAMHGQDLLLANGSVHKLWRRALNPIVSPRALESYLPRITQAFADMWTSLAAQGGEVVLRDHIRCAQLRVMADILFGITFEGDSGEEAFRQLDQDFEHEINALFALPINIPGTAFYKGLHAARRIRTLLRSRFHEELQRHKTLETCTAAKGKERPVRNAIEAVVDMFHSGDPELHKLGSEEDLVVNNLLLLLEASHGTTMFATSALLAELHRPEHTVALTQVRQEVAAITASGAAINVESLGSMTYANACINEVLRLYPFAGGEPKSLPAGEVLDIRGKIIEGPADLLLLWSPSFIDADVFPEPLAFKPERWLDKTTEENVRVSEAARKVFMPFGLGSHICLGQNLARLTMKSMLIAYCEGAYDMHLVGQVERVPDIIPEWKVKDGVRACVRSRVQGA